MAAPEDHGTTLIRQFHSAEQFDAFVTILRRLPSPHLQVRQLAPGAIFIARNPRHPFDDDAGNGAGTYRVPGLAENVTSLLVRFSGPFPAPLQDFLVRQGLRHEPTAGPFHNAIQIPVNPCFWAMGQSIPVFEISYGMTGRGPQIGSMQHGVQEAKRLLGLRPGAQIANPSACLIA